uniref:Putative secreted protein n=1 Tax=Anopheles darlingi TaxID=43151 RepID=A0A2M4DKC9_ANODA
MLLLCYFFLLFSAFRECMCVYASFETRFQTEHAWSSLQKDAGWQGHTLAHKYTFLLGCSSSWVAFLASNNSRW